MPDMGGGLLAGAVWTPPIAVLQRGPAVHRFCVSVRSMHSTLLFCQGCRGVCRGGWFPSRPDRAVRHRISVPGTGNPLAGCLVTHARLPRGARDARAVSETVGRGARRELLASRVAGGERVSAVARQMGVSRQTASKWLSRARRGEPLSDRSSRPRRLAGSTPPEVEEAVCEARSSMLPSPLALAAATGPASSSTWT